MKRRPFRLSTVLRHYELQKQHAELSLQRARLAVQQSESTIAALQRDLAALASAMQTQAVQGLSLDAWIACYRRSEQLDRNLAAAQARKAQLTAAVLECEQVRKKWAIAEETLQKLRSALEQANEAEAEKSWQEAQSEHALQKWTHGPREAE